MLPLQIRFNDGPTRLTAAAVPYGASVVIDGEFAFIVDVDGEQVVMTPYEFACHDASCRPPGSGGTGGSRAKGGSATGNGSASKPHLATGYHSVVDAYDPDKMRAEVEKSKKSTGGEGGRFIGGGKGTLGGGEHRIGADQHADDMRQLIASEQKDFANNLMNADGTLGLPFTKPGGGGTIEFDPKMQKWVDDKLSDLGVTHKELVDNLVKDGLDAINGPDAAKAIKWYDTENEWGTNLAKTYGVEIDRVFAAVSLTSAMRKWGVEGTGTNASSTNKGAIETILKKLKDDEPFEVTAEMAANFNTFKGEKKGIGEGAQITPGIYRPSDLSSASVARLATGLGWKILNSAGTKPIAKAIAVIRGELEVNDVVRGTKQRSFVSNLAHPEIDYTSTNDLWHFRAVAGNSQFNFPDRRKNEDGTPVVSTGTGSKIRTTLDDYESHTTGYNKKDGKPERGNAPHDIFTGGPPNSGMYTEVTKITRQALDTLATRDVRFEGMKIHEFQALVWKYAGGNAGSDT